MAVLSENFRPSFLLFTNFEKGVTIYSDLDYEQCILQ